MPNTRQVRSLWPDDLMDGFERNPNAQGLTLTDSPLTGERPMQFLPPTCGTADVTFTDPGTASDQTIVSRWVYPNDGTLHCGGTQTVTTTNYFTDVNFELIGDAFRQVGVTAREAARALGQLAEAADATLDLKIMRMTQEEIDLHEANELAWVEDCRAQTVELQEQARARQEQERLAFLRRSREVRAAAEKEERRLADERRKAAEARGWDLLKDVVGEEEYEKFKEVGHLDVQSPSDGKLIYRVRQGRRIALVRNGVESTKESLCIHPNQMFVQGDKVAAQVMWCMMNEKKLMEVANVHRCAA